MTPTHFYAMADVVEIDRNPENADVTNPTGARHGFAAFVVAEDGAGNRRRWHVRTGPLESAVLGYAERQAEALTARLAAGKLPVGFDSWAPCHAAYGSPAHDEDELIAWEREMDERF